MRFSCWSGDRPKSSAVPPTGISLPGGAVVDPTEGLVRRARRAGRQRYVQDQLTGRVRPPAAAFEPRLPENRPNATRHDKYLSVNVVSSLTAARLPRDWRGNSKEFYSAHLPVAICHDLSLAVTWEPDVGHPEPADDNPHHGAIRGIVEMFYIDRDTYELAITTLAKASEVFPECLP